MTEGKWTYKLDKEVNGEALGYSVFNPNGRLHGHVDMRGRQTTEVEMEARRDIAKRNNEPPPKNPRPELDVKRKQS